MKTFINLKIGLFRIIFQKNILIYYFIINFLDKKNSCNDHKNLFAF
jgi:hypothetical protein